MRNDWSGNTMKVNEIFYSLQGEGKFMGTPAVFLRFSGCNLKCSFCDTNHGSYVEMDEEGIIREVKVFPSRHIVITGGEPMLQLTPSLCKALHKEGFFIQVETNGSLPLPNGCEIDWTTCSPKVANLSLKHTDELKVVYWGQDISIWETANATEYRLQPLDTQDDSKNKDILAKTINYILKHPVWSLSLQTHKMIDVK